MVALPAIEAVQKVEESPICTWFEWVSNALNDWATESCKIVFWNWASRWNRTTRGDTPSWKPCMPIV